MNFEDIKTEIYKIFGINYSSYDTIYVSIYRLYKSLYQAYNKNEYIQYKDTIRLLTENNFEYRKIFI